MSYVKNLCYLSMIIEEVVCMNPWGSSTTSMKLYGSFIEADSSIYYKTNDIDSAVDILAERDEDAFVVPSNRFRNFIYRRVEEDNGSQRIILIPKKMKAKVSREFDKVYYLPFLNRFIGFQDKRLYIFSPDSDETPFWGEKYKTCYVFGKFVFYSLDNENFGLLDVENGSKVEPFFKMDPWWNGSTKLLNSWTDEFWPVQIGEDYYLVDRHGNAFCKTSKEFKKYRNVFRSFDASKNAVLFGVGANGCPCEIAKVYVGLNSKNDILVAMPSPLERRETFWDAHGKQHVVGNVSLDTLDYYATPQSDDLVLNPYFKYPLKTRGYSVGELIHNAFRLLRSKDGKYGLINEETNLIAAEPIYDEIIKCGDGFRLSYGDSFIYLDELGNFVSRKVL